MKSNLSSGNSSAGERNAEPALLTRMSTRPCRSTTRSASASTSAFDGHVEVVGVCHPTLLRDERRRLGAAGIVDVGKDHRHARLGIADGDGASQPAASRR